MVGSRASVDNVFVRPRQSAIHWTTNNLYNETKKASRYEKLEGKMLRLNADGHHRDPRWKEEL